MATWNNALGMWKASNGTYWNSKEEADAQEQGGAAPVTSTSDADFAANQGQAAIAPASQGVSRSTQGDAYDRLQAQADQTGTGNILHYDRNASQASTPEQQAAAYASGNIGGASGAYNVATPQGKAAYDVMHSLNSSPLLNVFNASPGGAVTRQTSQMLEDAKQGKYPMTRAFDVPGPALAPFGADKWLERGGQAQARFITHGLLGPGIKSGDQTPFEAGQPLNFVDDKTLAQSTAPATTPTGAATAASAAPTPPSDLTSETGATADALGDQYNSGSAASDAKDQGLWSDARDYLMNLDKTDTSQSDESRAWQREGLAQQRDLLQRMLGYDPNAYAAQFGDQALARTIAAGRSTGGGYAAQQQGMLAAQDQAPSLYAEGARQAASLENQRLSAAESASQAFGNLGTGIRSQDTQQAQFESTLGLSVANSLNDLTKGEVSLDEQERQRWAEVWVDFAKLQSVYAGMDETEQLHQLDLQFQDKQLGQQWEMFKKSLAAQGKITPKDIIGGLFQLGGGAISAGGTVLAAGAKASGGS